eukprot:NODE_218_length_12464_cov_0.653781.p5 type:complete len:353 gc:universal NODE_218_length_12464_cov_0.653781:4099-5157(+)
MHVFPKYYRPSNSRKKMIFPCFKEIDRVVNMRFPFATRMIRRQAISPEYLDKYSKEQLIAILSAYGKNCTKRSTFDLKSMLLSLVNKNHEITHEILDLASDCQYKIDAIVGHRIGIMNGELRLLYKIKWTSFADLTEEDEDNSTIKEHILQYYHIIGSTEEEVKHKLYSSALHQIGEISLIFVKKSSGSRPMLNIPCKWKVRGKIISTIENEDLLTKKCLKKVIEAKIRTSFLDKLDQLLNSTVNTILSSNSDRDEYLVQLNRKPNKAILPRKYLYNTLAWADSEFNVKAQAAASFSPLVAKKRLELIEDAYKYEREEEQFCDPLIDFDKIVKSCKLGVPFSCSKSQFIFQG